MGSLTREVIRTGSPQPLPDQRRLRAGPLSVTLEEGALRSIYLGSREVLRGLYAAVRDHNWGTIVPRFLSYEVYEQEDSFEVRFVAEHIHAEVDFTWLGTISGSSAGEITFTFDGQARNAFRKNRIGFCVLHPMELAGAELEVETPGGVVKSVFPEAISPHQPFKDIVAMRYACPSTWTDEPAVKMELRFDGELFEMEDQRNWTDASYKTYCTPLRLPYPVEIAAGERIVQRVILRPLHYPVASVDQAGTEPEQLSVSVSVENGRPLPELGLPFTRHHMSYSHSEVAYIRALHPAYLWTELDLAHADWQDMLSQAWEDTSLLGTDLELSVVCDQEGGELAALFRVLVEKQVTCARLCCFARATHVTTRAMLEQARTLRTTAGLSMQLGAGSRANFAEFNRADLPLDLAELTSYPINPQVHAFDNRSLVETLQAQAVTALNALRIAPGLPLSVGPVTFKPRFNAAATAPEDAAEQETMPAYVDPRQVSLFGAGWTVGSVHRLAGSGARWLTYYQATGWCGLLEQAQQTRSRGHFPPVAGALFPLYHVFADIADFRAGELLESESSDPLAVEALALRQDTRILLLVANLTADRQTILLRLPESTAMVARVLDETTAQEAMYEPARFRQRSQSLAWTAARQVTIDLLPYAVMRIEGMLEDK